MTTNRSNEIRYIKCTCTSKIEDATFEGQLQKRFAKIEPVAGNDDPAHETFRGIKVVVTWTMQYTIATYLSW